MNESDTISAVESAVSETIRQQLDHLKRGRVERTFTSDLAKILEPYFVDENVSADTFYNKHGQLIKKLDGHSIELDIVIHERGIDDHNLVAIELETNNSPERDDIWKLEKMTEELGGFGYKLGLFLVVGISSRAGEIITMEWYKNGRRL